MVNIEHFFPTSIGNSFCPFHNEIENGLTDYCFDIEKKIDSNVNHFNNNGQLYSTFKKHDILSDEKFTRLNQWIINQVKEYANQLKMKIDLKCEGHGFFNIYKKYNYQEVHDHGGSLISCIYFLKSNEKASRVFFKSRMYDNVEYEGFYAPSGSIFFNPQPGKLLIFRGHTQHYVEQHLDDEKRISLAYNFLN